MVQFALAKRSTLAIDTINVIEGNGLGYIECVIFEGVDENGVSSVRSVGK